MRMNIPLPCVGVSDMSKFGNITYVIKATYLGRALKWVMLQ